MLNRLSYESIKVTERARLNQKLQVTNLAAAAKGYLTNKSRKEMIQTELKGHRVLVVDLPEGYVAKLNGSFISIFRRPIDEGGVVTAQCYDLPPGSWSFLFADPMKPTEEEAAQWVEHNGLFEYKDFESKFPWWKKSTALASFQSWLRSVGAKENSVVLIDKTESNG